MSSSIFYCIRRGQATLLGALAVCALCGCWEEVYYEESDAGTDKSDTIAAPSEDSETAVSPAQQPDAAASAGVSDAGRTAPPAGEEGDEASRFADDLATSLSSEPSSPATASPTAPPQGGAEAAGASSPAVDQPPPAGPSAAVDDLFAPPEKAAEPAPPTAAAAAQQPSTRRLAWLLGSKWSLSALARDQGAPDEEVEKWFGQSRRLADALGLALPNLPERATSGGDRPAGGAALDYLFEQGQQVGRDLASLYGPDHAALFELAVKSNILLVLYEPGASVVDAIASAVREASVRAGLPAELCEPLLAALARDAPRADVSQAVFRLHDEVDRYLAAPTP